jgi:hypothetical protein
VLQSWRDLEAVLKLLNDVLLQTQHEEPIVTAKFQRNADLFPSVEKIVSGILGSPIIQNCSYVAIHAQSIKMIGMASKCFQKQQ